MEFAPILLFAYRRPDHTRKLLESLAHNAEAKDSELHVFIDGPKEEKDVEKIDEVEFLVRSKPWCKEVYICRNDKNRGDSPQVIDAVTKFCKERGRVIVLEDDLVLSPFFLDYMNKALNVYADKERVMEITGYMYPVKNLSIESGFLRGSCGWGWGTWQRAWKHFESDGSKLLARFSDKKLQYEFDFKNSYRFYGLLKAQIAGKVGGWDVRWAASIFFNNGLTFLPGSSLVKNIGLDGSGTHIPDSNAKNTTILNRPINEYPNEVEETKEMLAATINFFKAQRKLGALLSKLIQRIQKGRLWG